MAWRIAESLRKLRAEVDAKWPNRSRTSDGSIGDEAHASRSSDHNPWVKDGNIGIVTAIDITHDPKNGCDSYSLAEYLRATRDPRIKYIISNRRICSSETRPWEWRPYHGANPHDHHVHISVKPEKKFYDDPGTWNLSEGKMPVHDLPQPRSVPPTLRVGSIGEDVKKLQTLLTGENILVEVDGSFGSKTKNGVQFFQEAVGLVPDGVVGPQTWKALLEGK